jgi:hypothetical protein
MSLRGDDPPGCSWFDKHGQTKSEIDQPMTRSAAGISPKGWWSSNAVPPPIGAFKFCGEAPFPEPFPPHPVGESVEVANQDVVKLFIR